MSDKKLVHVELPSTVVERLDLLADYKYKSRSSLIREAVLNEVEIGEQQNDLHQVATLAFKNGDIDLETLERIVGVEKAKVVVASLNHLDEKEEIIDRHAEYIDSLDNDELNDDSLDESGLGPL